MQHIDQAIEQASAKGLAVTIVTIHPADGYEEADVEDAYAAAAVPATPTAAPGTAGPAVAPDPAMAQRAAAAEAKVHELSAQVADLQKQLQAAAGGDAGAALAQANAKVAELEQQLTQAKAAASNGNGAAAAGGGDAGATLASYESYPQDVLGLSEKAQKGINRVGCTTVGEVKQALLEGKLAGKNKGDGRLGRLEVIEVANKLLGQVPSAAGAAPAPAGGGDPSAPTGLKMPTWEERIASARKKELAAEGEKQKILQAQQQLQQLRAQQMTPDVQQNIDAWQKAHDAADKMLAMFEGQIATLLYTSGLPHNLKQVRTVNGALEAAGLHHLVSEAPAPEGVPAGASA